MLGFIEFLMKAEAAFYLTALPQCESGASACSVKEKLLITLGAGQTTRFDSQN